MGEIKPDRLFVPLSTRPFKWFENGAKRWEVRRYGGQFTHSHVYKGRIVELRKGYSSEEKIWGQIKEIISTKELERIFKNVPYHQIIPDANSSEEAIEKTTHILNGRNSDGYIAFKIDKNMEHIEIDDEFISDIESGRKETTIRRGFRNYETGPAIIFTEERKIPIIIKNVTYKFINQLTNYDARRDGFTNQTELIDTLDNFYPGINENTPITIVEFEVLQK
ncbi:ASCH domain-containing protein [Haladaptatus halobius]|uniref:ASCH domain-containing protein n=1 Tax=Haladaptatus halobius TaxID=2884875 RepID=UPI001D0AF41C|nr:ASCH domain-containing protein [Haladaptatus halobius]